jgi:methylated-DNA-[protein]-cysteine S-methyltransferase
MLPETTMFYTWFDAPLTRILLAGDKQSLHFLLFESGKHFQQTGIPGTWQADDRPFADCIRQLNEYFAGDRTEFDLTLRLDGTKFQRRVWQELTRIPHGETISYAQLASRVGQPGAFRAVGSANGKNPISIIVPCHRVIGSNGQLAGYGGGLTNKVELLRLEGLHIDDSPELEKAVVRRSATPTLFPAGG